MLSTTALDALNSSPSAHTPADDDTAPTVDPPSENSAADTARPEADSLALSDYDHLPSADVVAKLEGLDQAERDAIEAYERGGRHRRTILGKLDRLRTEAPS